MLKKISYILIILAIAPFALEVVLRADVAGAEFAVLFAIYYLKSKAYILLERWMEFKRSAVAVCILLSCLMWLPPLYLSSGLLS